MKFFCNASEIFSFASFNRSVRLRDIMAKLNDGSKKSTFEIFRPLWIDRLVLLATQLLGSLKSWNDSEEAVFPRFDWQR